MGTITQEIEKRKKGLFLALESAFPVAIVVLVGFASFGMGRLSAMESSKQPIEITQATLTSNPIEMAPGGLILGTKSSKKYRFPWCPGAETIKASNKVWFDSEEAARAAGYTPAGNCPGLK